MLCDRRERDVEMVDVDGGCRWWWMVVDGGQGGMVGVAEGGGS